MRQVALLFATSLLVTGLAACDQAKKAAEPQKSSAKAENSGKKPADHQEPAVQKVMANPEQAPAAKPAAPATAQAPAGGALKLEGKQYGAGVSATESVSISDLHKRVDALVGKRVRVEGTVTDVCPMRGCWFNMASDEPGKTLRFKVRDGVMVFPMSAKGQYAVAEGVVRKIPLNLEQTKRVLAHEAEEKGEPFDPSTVTEAITLVRLDGVGAVLRDKR